MKGPPPLTPRALRTRGGLARLVHAEAIGGGSAAPVCAMGLAFPGRAGLAAGFDRHGVLAGRAAALGFGSIELGTWTADTRRALVAHGASHAGGRAAPCGVSLGKRAGTPWGRAADDYAEALRLFHARADYVTVNPGRERPAPERFAEVVAALAPLRKALEHDRGRPLPMVVKLPAAWLAAHDRVHVAARFVDAGAQGLLVSAEGAGSPVAACAVLAGLAHDLGREVCIISVGGIASVRTALARVRAGARLVQLHRAAGTRDTGLVVRINRALARR